MANNPIAGGGDRLFKGIIHSVADPYKQILLHLKAMPCWEPIVKNAHALSRIDTMSCKACKKETIWRGGDDWFVIEVNADALITLQSQGEHLIRGVT